MKYRKKDVIIEAYQTDKELIIHTLEGDMKANIGDYIITGVKGERYPCKPDIFEKTYEPVTNTNFDRIKAMSVEEMALMLMCPAEYDLSFNKKCGCNGEFNRDCNECCKNWLESEVQEDE